MKHTANSLISVQCLLCEKVKLSQIFQALTYSFRPTFVFSKFQILIFFLLFQFLPGKQVESLFRLFFKKKQKS
jgi:hypothetical protein